MCAEALLSQSCGCRRCALLRTRAIVGFAKMPLQASIFTDDIIVLCRYTAERRFFYEH